MKDYDKRLKHVDTLSKELTKMLIFAQLSLEDKNWHDAGSYLDDMETNISYIMYIIGDPDFIEGR